jgi:integrase
MRWSQIDLETAKVEVIRGKGGIDSTLFMSKRLRAVLERRAKTREDDYIFPSKRKFNNNYKWLNDALERADIDTTQGRITLHTLRHTFATRMLKANVTIVELQSLLGHKHIQSTLIYSHFEISALSEKAVRILDERMAA